MNDYRDSLIMALRLKDVPGDRIGEIVAEVESHVAETGEDPVEAFGPAHEYAVAVTAGHRRDPWWSTALIAGWSAAAGWFLAQGAFAVLLGEQYLGRSGWWWIGLGLVIGVPGGFAVARRSTQVRDPRTGEDMAPSSPWGVMTLVGAPLATVLLAFAAIRLWG